VSPDPTETGLIGDLDAFLGAFGIDEGEIAWYFAHIPWRSDADRDNFIAEMTR
jgi:hypothetical protein